MITLDQFVNKWLGGRTDYDKVYAYQCVDLILQYLSEVHGISSGVWGNAIDYWTKPTPGLLRYFQKMPAGTRAQAGDIVVLNGTAGNPYGHIMVAVNGDTAIEQNGATGDGDGQGGDEVRYRTIPYSRVAGILRKIGASDMAIIPDQDNYYWRYGKKLAMQLRGRELSREEFRKSIVGQSDLRVVEILSDDPEADRAQQWQDVGRVAVTDKWDSQIYTLQDQVKNQKAEADSKIDTLVKAGAIKDGEIDRLNKENESLRSQVGDGTKWETLKTLLRELLGLNK